MIKKLAAFILLVSLSLAWESWAHIKRTVFIKLHNGQQVLLMYDAYEGGSNLDNNLNAAFIALGVKKMAENHPDTWIDLSFEDPAVYDAGADLIIYLGLIEKVIPQIIPKDRFLALLPKIPGKAIFDIMSFARPAKLSTFMAGDFTFTLGLLHQHGWPKNLTIRSNDPRHDHYMSLIKSKEWLLNNGDYMRMADLLKTSWKLHDKISFFELSQDWSPDVMAKITTRINIINNLENERVTAFANYASMRTGVNYTSNDFLQPISFFNNKIDLSIIYDFLTQHKNMLNIYGDSPVLDVLLTLLKKDGPGTSVVILGERNAHELVCALDELGVVSKKIPLDPIESLNQLYQGL
jgi:hypothetical protein